MAFSVSEYGIDLKFDDTLRLTTSKKFQVSSGKDNVAQALRNRLRTRKGALFGHDDYGSSLPELIGEPLDDRTVKLAKLYFIEAVVSDPRISELKDVSVVEDMQNYAIILSGTAIAIDGYSEINIVYPFSVNGEV